MELISALQFLRLNEIPKDWVDAVWDLEFTEEKPLDDSIEEELHACREDAFRTLYHCLVVHAADQQQSADAASLNVWAILGENGVSIKTLVAVLSLFVLVAKAKDATTQQRVNGLYSASLYLLLLGIPGSIANKVFHEVLLDTCCDLTCLCWPHDAGKKRKKEGQKGSRGKSKRSKPQQKEPSEMEVDEEEGVDFSGCELVKIRNAVAVLVQSLLRLLQTFPLTNTLQSADNCTRIFIKLLYFEPVVGELTLAAPRDVAELRSIPEMAFYGLKLLCDPKHGDQKKSLRRLFHHLLYVILMMDKSSGRQPSPLVLNQSVISTRNQAIQFVCHCVEEQKELALPFLQILLEHICFQMVEKAEFRSNGAQAVGMLTSEMSSTDYARFVKWLSTCSRATKMVHRLFSVDVVMVLLKQPERSPKECQDPELTGFLPHKFLIQDLLFARRVDASPTVQGHALSCLAQCLELPSLNATQAVHNLFSATGNPTILDSELPEGTVRCQNTQKTFQTLPFRTVDLSSANSSASDAAKENVALLLCRVKDSRTNVRKAALQAVLGLLKYNVIPLTWENLETLAERSRDTSVSVKKKALQCVGELLVAKPESRLVQKAWLLGVLPAVMDSEDSVQQKALEALEQVLLSQVKPYSASCHVDTSQKLCWDLLELLSQECKNLSRYFSRAFSIWSKQEKFTRALITNLISHTEADHAVGAWLLLSKVVFSSPRVSYNKILDAWDKMITSQDMNVTTCCLILSVMGDIAAHLNNDTKDRIVADLMTWLKTFSLRLEVISAALETLYHFGSRQDVEQTQDFLNHHCGELLSTCEAYLTSIILREHGDENLMIKHLHTLGVASLHCPAKVSKKTILLVESLLIPVKPAEYQEELPASLPLSQFKQNSMPTRVKAHGVLALGKLCLQHEDLIPKYLPVLARELEVGTDVSVRNNIVMVMCDLCIRCTNMVVHYIPNISACLRDDNSVIREQTLIMLTNLLQEEYVKWKGSLFFRFVVALVDPVPTIASLCEYCLLHRLLKKNPEMFSQHFIECIFHFNSYGKHKSYNKFPQTEREKIWFSLKGAKHHDKRFRIYRFLLENLTDAQRFNITNKINLTVLACFADEELPLDADGAEILSETFQVLSLKEMKLQMISSPEGEAGEEAEEESPATMAKAVMQAAQRKVVSQVHKKAFMMNTAPLIISLKSLLEQKRSPVLRDLMDYLKVLMKDNHTEVKELLGDEQLVAEVEFALKTENERLMQQLMDGCSLAADSPGSAQSPPSRPRPLEPFRFATPQQKRLNSTSTRKTRSDCHVPPSGPEKPVPSKSVALDGTGMTTRAINNRAFSTPDGTRLTLTFNEGLSTILSDPASIAAGSREVLDVSSEEPRAGASRLWNVESPLRLKKRPTRR
nr:condensin-2 complex subunit D3 isoform X1 [Nothobranchius furzeri]